jgi:hypothetical protein
VSSRRDCLLSAEQLLAVTIISTTILAESLQLEEMNPSALFILLSASISSIALGFLPVRTGMNGWKVQRSEGKSVVQVQAAGDNERGVFNSKLLPDLTDEEIAEMFKEFNITTAWDINKDPELTKWAPSKEFFEKFGFQNNTERYKRKTMHVKMDFYSNYTKPLLPQYKTFIADVMAMTFVQSMDSRYKYDALHAFGICTQYYTIMKGYALQDEVRK